MTVSKLAIAAMTLGVAAAAAPAGAAVVTFATFSAPTTIDNFRLVNSGNSSSRTRTTDATLYTTATGTATTPGAALVRFSFTQPFISNFIDNVTAAFTYNATIARGTPASVLTGQGFTELAQSGITGSFSFLTTSAITISGPHYTTHTFAAGSNLLSGTFTNATLIGSGSSAGTTSSTESGRS